MSQRRNSSGATESHGCERSGVHPGGDTAESLCRLPSNLDVSRHRQLHGGSVSLTKRSQNGLTFRTNYTFSKVIDLDSAILSTSAQNDPATILNPYNLKLNRGLASYNPAHQFSSSFSDALPVGRQRSHWMGPKTDRRLAVERHLQRSERVSRYADGWLEPVR